MKKYFLHPNGQRTGPYSAEELRMMAISASTPVWCEELEGWQNAGDIPELHHLFFTSASTPPSPPSFHQPSIFPPPPPSYYYPARQLQKYKPTKKLKRTVILICLISVVGITFFVFLLKKFDEQIELRNSLQKKGNDTVLNSSSYPGLYHEKMPEFPGGTAALHEFISDQIKYPTYEKENGIQGTVYVKFTVEKNGDVTNGKIVRSVSPGLDRETLRMVKKMPNWKPGTINGKPVRIEMTQPVRFKLE